MIDWIALLVFLGITGITPGPNNITCLYLGASYGFKGLKRFMIGSCSGLFIKTVLCGFLNYALEEAIPGIETVLRYLGFAYLVYLGVKMGISGFVNEKDDEVKEKEYGIVSGLMLQVLNVKSWIACLSVFAVYVLPFEHSWVDILIISVVFTLICVASSLIWAGFGHAIRKFIKKYKKPFGIVMGLALIYLAITAIIK